MIKEKFDFHLHNPSLCIWLGLDIKRVKEGIIKCVLVNLNLKPAQGKRFKRIETSILNLKIDVFVTL